MAYSSVRVQFEIGHEASLRTKKTPEGFTHDWEVFVRGADNTDIQCFVDKVVFRLHDTFPKPRRVIKEPPYVVKESGYAGFVLPIDVYLKNKEEPKKISFNYDLQLQNSGPPISRVLREPRVFQNPSEDFRRKLIRGGGVGVDTPSEGQAEDSKSSASVKSKIPESPAKKYKPELTINNSFAELFGTPIRRITPEPKKTAEAIKRTQDVSDKDKKKLSKHSPHKEEKEKYSDKDKNKEREKIKEKTSKRPPTPPPAIKSKEDHKKHEDKDKKKEEHDDKKKRKEEKEKKDKYKDSEKEYKKEKKDNEFNLKKLNSSKSHEAKPTNEKHNSEGEKDKPEKEKHKHRHKKREKEKNREKEKHKKDKDYKEKERDKDKNNRKKYEETKEKEEKAKKKSPSPVPVPEKSKKGPLNALLSELGSSSGDSASQLSEDDSIPSFKSLPKTTAKIVPEIKPQPVVNSNPKVKSTNLTENKIEKEIDKSSKNEEISPSKSKKDKSPGKKSKKSEKDSEKRKMKEEHKMRSPSSEREKEEEEAAAERLKKEKEEKEKLEKEEKERLERERQEAEKQSSKANKKEKETNRKRKREKSADPPSKTKKDQDNHLGASQSSGGLESSEVQEEPRKVDRFTKEYVAQLRDLQHRIMSLEDNAELQKVVQVIAETGQYEITKKTFDFDLCALDSETVKKLQEFFSNT